MKDSCEKKIIPEASPMEDSQLDQVTGGGRGGGRKEDTYVTRHCPTCKTDTEQVFVSANHYQCCTCNIINGTILKT